ncbi:MAG TPA: PEP-CTERM sorting domain-containing protein [Tepidisphaeraceae bacterium]|nr:PEP-CTERM sorting domain-containing protein [Tepidisphaeraceae bacterium]
MRSILGLCAAAAVLGAGSISSAALSLSQNDGASPVSYTNGGGGSFGGPLGTGTFTFDAVGANLVITYPNASSLGGNVVGLLLDTKSGGETDSTMNDSADGGRRAVSQQSINADDAYPTGFLADYGVAFTNSGVVVFGLVPGTNMNFISFTGTAGTATIPLATLGLGSAPANVDWFAGLFGDSGYGSNESLPASSGLNSAAEVGFGSTSAGYQNFNRFVIPEPTTLAALAGLGLIALRRK